MQGDSDVKIVSQIKAESPDFLTPSIEAQVRGHLFTGALVRWDLKLTTVVLLPALVAMVAGLFTRGSPVGSSLIALVVFFGLRRLPVLIQATACWYGIKCCGVIAGFIVMTVGTLSTGFGHGTPLDAAVVFVSGLAIFPSLEFFPRFVPHQRWVSLGRMVLLLGCLIYALWRDGSVFS